MSRGKAFALHIAISLAALAAVFAVVRFYWYPYPYLGPDGGWPAFGLLAGASLVVGPPLTLLVARPGKKGLRFDLTAIALLQLAVFALGLHLLYMRRVQMVVYSRDAFFALDAAHLAIAGPKGQALATRLPGYPAYAFVHLPASRLARDEAEIRTLKGEPPVYLRGWRYRPYTEADRRLVLARSLPMTEIVRHDPTAARALARFRVQHPDLAHYAFVPLHGTYASVVVALRRRDNAVAGVLNFNPNPYCPY